MDLEPPHANLYTFNGLLKYSTRELEATDGGAPLRQTQTGGSVSSGAWREKLEPATINELLLRGCTIRNSTWIIGLVVFTGADTKIMLNGGETPSKRSKIEVETNFNVIMNFIILMGLCFVSGGGISDLLTFSDCLPIHTQTTAIVYYTVELKSGRSFNFFEVGSTPSDNKVVNALVIFVCVRAHPLL